LLLVAVAAAVVVVVVAVQEACKLAHYRLQQDPL
jgi:hypothetical protein